MSWSGGRGKNLSEIPPALKNSKPLTDVPNALRKSSKYRCEWEGCGKECSRRYNLTVHMRMHTGEAPYRCEYPGCKLRFKWKSSLVHHERGHKGDAEERHSTNSRYADRMEDKLRFKRETSSVSGHFSRSNGDSTRGSDSLTETHPQPTPLETPLVTVSSLESLLNDPVEDQSYHSLLSFDLSQDDLSVASSLNQRLSLAEALDPPSNGSGVLERMVLPGEQWR